MAIFVRGATNPLMSKQLNSIAALTVAVSVPLIAETPNSTTSATKTKKLDTAELVKEEKIFALPHPSRGRTKQVRFLPLAGPPSARSKTGLRTPSANVLSPFTTLLHSRRPSRTKIHPQILLKSQKIDGSATANPFTNRQSPRA